MRYLELKVSITEVDPNTGCVYETSIVKTIETDDVISPHVGGRMSEMGLRVREAHARHSIA